uniref:Uncharacterized protein n=1 Tax=Romanomermis culicivorax TaxID=13658 RepID=A0A915L2I3_ROMCU
MRRKFLVSTMSFLKSGGASTTSSTSSSRHFRHNHQTIMNNTEFVIVKDYGNSTLNLTDEQKLILTSMWHKDDFDYLYEIGIKLLWKFAL